MAYTVLDSRSFIEGMILSAENQKGINSIWQSFVENQKGIGHCVTFHTEPDGC